MMQEKPKTDERQTERLKARLKRLADEKSYLQLIIRLIEQLNPLSRLEEMIGALLNGIVETIGGTDIKLFYWADGGLHYATFLGESSQLNTVDDPMVTRAIATCQFQEEATAADNALLKKGVLPGAWNWAFPLLIGEELVGVIKLENIHVSATPLRHALPVFFSHAALILSNGIRAHTERKMAEALRRKTEELDNYFNQALDLFCIADTQGHFRKLNPMWEQTLGYPLSELVGHPFMELIHPDDIAATRAAVSNLSKQKPVLNFVNRYRHKDGSYRWIEWRSRPSGDQIFAAARDITDSKLAEQRLQESEQRYRATFDQAAVGIARLALDGNWLEINRKLADILGYPREELQQLTFPQLLRPQEREREQLRIQQLLAGSQHSYRTEKQLLCKDGASIWSNLTVSLLRDDEGEPLYFILVMESIQPRKAAERELADYRRHLEELVEKRTRDLSAAKDIAESANRMKSVFLANMSHELRTPLNAILGFAQLMERDQRIPDDQRQNIGIINRSGRHLLALINDVLTISRIEAGKLQVSLEVLDLAELLHEVTDIMALRAANKGLTLGLRAAPELPRHILGDLGKLRQILLNLLANAVKYTSEGEILLAAEVQPLPPSDTRVQLTFEVRDTGAGIDEADLKHLFEPFFQTEHGIQVGEGAGLGLAICQEYSRVLNGRLSATSEPGRGSIFRFSLPVEPRGEGRHASERGAGQIIGLAPDQPGYRVLVAEDQSDNLRLIVALLEQTGFQVRVANDGRQAVDLFRSWQPHFIWMDMRMPEMDGYQATRAIRALPGGQEIPIVALTASVFAEERDAIVAAGCNDILGKPFTHEEFFGLLGRLLGVRYRYRDERPDEGDAAARQEQQDLGEIEPQLRQELRQAAEILDSDGVNTAIERIGADNPKLAEYLTSLVAGYDFDRIGQLCRKAGADASAPQRAASR